MAAYFRLLLVVICVYFHCGLSGETSAYQISGLRALYEANSGDNWFWKSSSYGIEWDFTNSSSNPCMDNWQGVTCTMNCSQVASCDITEISLAQYGLTGSLPPEISLLSQLQYMNFYRNFLAGPIPTSMGTMAELTNLIVYRNCITGTIPLELGQLSKMVYFDLGFNNLNGTLPWFEFPLLEVYFADTNMLTGTIPTQFGTLSYLTLFAVCVNSLTGTLPTEFGMISQLSVLNLHANSFTGRVPPSYNDLHQLKIMNMAFNFLTGPAADMIVSDEMFYFYMSDNFFTGSFPFDELCQSTKLLGLLYGNNQVTGTISPCIGNWSSINTMDFSQNQLQGKLPDVLFSLTNLDTLILASNFLNGQLGSVLVPGLVTLDISDNAFSGTLPYVVFHSENLKTFVAVKNCFTGTLSSQICNASGLNTLELSGLTAGRGCRGTYTAAFLQIQAKFALPFAGSIPSCVFSMSNLTQFGLSGNAINSELYDLPETSLLENVSLSNNRLYGTIPRSFQTHFAFRTLDLSFNRLMGNIEGMTNYTLSYETVNNSVPVNQSISLNLHGNRLSGMIPSAFATTTSVISILAGNTFLCPRRSDLPENDPFVSKYDCGSDEVNYFSYACAVGIGVLTVMCMVSIYYMDLGVTTTPATSVNGCGGGGDESKRTVIAGSDGVNKSIRQVFADSEVLKLVLRFLYWKDEDSTGHLQLDSLAASLVRYRRCCVLLVCMIVLIALPAYIGLKYTGQYSTHEQQYGWLPTAAYLQYNGPAVTMLVLWLLFLGFIIAYDFYFVERVRGAVRQTSVHKMGWRRFGLFCLVVLANGAIVLVANGMYVYVALSQSTVIQGVVSFLMVCFKLTYNIVIVIPLLDALSVKFITIMGFMIFNNNVAPIMATMAVDLSCFESLFVPVKQLTATYTVSHCSLLFTGTTTTTGSGTGNVVCDMFDTVENTLFFDSPFVYSNQCSSALLSAYVPLYLVTYGIIGISVAAVQFMIMLYFTDLGGPHPELTAEVVYGRRRNKSMDGDGGGGSSSKHHRSWAMWRIYTLQFLKRSIHSCSRFTNKALCAMVLPLNALEDLQTIGRQRIYHSRQLALNYSVVFTVLVTFGIACPALGVVLMINLVMSTLVMQICMYRHYVHAQALQCASVWSDLLLKETRDFHKIIYSSRSFIVLFSALFATLFIFDMTYYHDTPLLVWLVVLLIGGVYGAIQVARYCYKRYPGVKHGRSRVGGSFDAVAKQQQQSQPQQQQSQEQSIELRRYGDATAEGSSGSGSSSSCSNIVTSAGDTVGSGKYSRSGSVDGVNRDPEALITVLNPIASATATATATAAAAAAAAAVNKY